MEIFTKIFSNTYSFLVNHIDQHKASTKKKHPQFGLKFVFEHINAPTQLPRDVI